MTGFDLACTEISARENLLRTALRVMTAERDDPHADHDDEVRYAGEQLALAARELVRAVDAMPEDDQPVGWDDTCSVCDERIPVGQLFVTPGGNSMCIPCATEGDD